MSHDNDDDVYNLGDADAQSGGHSDNRADSSHDSHDDGSKFNEATVVRPRSVLDDAFDAHTIVRPESARRLGATTQPATAQPPPPPAPEPEARRAPTPPPTSFTPPPSTPPPSSQARTVKDAVTSPSISKRFRQDSSVTNFPIPPAIHIELPEEKPAGPTPAQIAEAQAVALAQENARQKAEQAAKQASAEQAARRAQQEQQRAAAAAAAAAQKAELEAKQAAVLAASRRQAEMQNQSAHASSSGPSENTGNFRFEETQSNYKEPARRKLDFRIVAAVVVVAGLGAYMVFGGSGAAKSGESRPQQQKEMASAAPVHEVAKEPVAEFAAPPVAAGPAASSGPTANVLAGFEDAFSRTQVRSRPDSRD